jgi:hypothetical protein
LKRDDDDYDETGKIELKILRPSCRRVVCATATNELNGDGGLDVRKLTTENLITKIG